MCLCGNSYGAAGTSTACTKPCTGESTAMCGGTHAYQVFATPTCAKGMVVGYSPSGG